MQRDGVGVFTPLWGSYTRQRAVEGATRAVEVDRDRRPGRARGQRGRQRPDPAGTTVLLGRDAGADALAGARAGDPVDVAYRPKASDGGDLQAAVGGGYVLVSDGVVQNIADPALRPAHRCRLLRRRPQDVPADGGRPAGRQPRRHADRAGPHDGRAGRRQRAQPRRRRLVHAARPGAGRGRRPGGEQPSDGSERHVPNGLALYAPKGSGRLTGYWLETASDPDRRPGRRAGARRAPRPGLPRPHPAAHRRRIRRDVRPGGRRPAWRADPAVHGVDRDGMFHAGAPAGRRSPPPAARPRARWSSPCSARWSGSAPPSTGSAWPARRHGLFGVVGYDADGNTAPIEPADLTLDYDRDLLEVTPTADGNLSVKALAATTAGAGHRQGRQAQHGPAGHRRASTTCRSPASTTPRPWRFSRRPRHRLGRARPGHTGSGLELSYDFSQSTATRAAYADPPQHDRGGRPAAGVRHVDQRPTARASGPACTSTTPRTPAHPARPVPDTWTGWKYVEFAVPAGVQYPLRLRRFYVAETKAAAQYTSEILIDDLVAKVPPTVTRRSRPEYRPGGGAATARWTGAPWRFAVLSDAQFVAADPDSDLVAHARRTLREVRAAKPGLPADQRRLRGHRSTRRTSRWPSRSSTRSSAARLPYHYVPGNHEVMGGRSTTSRPSSATPTRSSTTRARGSSRSTPRRRTCAAAASTRSRCCAPSSTRRPGPRRSARWRCCSTRPPRDPTPGKASQLGDRKEAALVEGWLADFQRTAPARARLHRRARRHVQRRPGRRGAVLHQRQLRQEPGHRGRRTAASPAGRCAGVDPVTAAGGRARPRDRFADAPELARRPGHGRT